MYKNSPSIGAKIDTKNKRVYQKQELVKPSPFLPQSHAFYNTSSPPGNRMYQVVGHQIERQLCSPYTLERRIMFYKVGSQEINLANTILSPSQEF